MDEIPTDITQETLCSVCHSTIALYKCPRCLTMTCSLNCCKLHKSQSSCSGERNRTEFVGIKSFEEKHLRSDFHFLEDVLQTKSRAKRTMQESFGGSNENGKKQQQKSPQQLNLPIPLLSQQTSQKIDNYSKIVKNLVNGAKSKNINLILMPKGMSRRQSNTSMFNTREGKIYWRLCLVFIMDEHFNTSDLLKVDVSVVGKRQMIHRFKSLIGLHIDHISDSRPLSEVLDEVLDVEKSGTAISYALRSIRLRRKELTGFMQKIPSPSENPLFREVTLSSNLEDSLSGTTVMEYPTLIVGTRTDTQKLRKLIHVDAPIEEENVGIEPKTSVEEHNKSSAVENIAKPLPLVDYDSDDDDEPLSDVLNIVHTNENSTISDAKESITKTPQLLHAVEQILQKSKSEPVDQNLIDTIQLVEVEGSDGVNSESDEDDGLDEEGTKNAFFQELEQLAGKDLVSLREIIEQVEEDQY